MVGPVRLQLCVIGFSLSFQCRPGVHNRGFCNGGILSSKYALDNPHISIETSLHSADLNTWTCRNTHPTLCWSCFNSPTCPVEGLSHSRIKVWFRLLSWNIDGLDERNPVARARAVCSFVKAKLPHAVFLQEAVPHTWCEIVKDLDQIYDCYSVPNPTMGYFVAILVHKTLVTIRGPMQCLNFTSSTMGRHLLQLPISYAGVNIDLFTSHLESTRNCSSERMRQLKIVFDIMVLKCKENQDTSCLFGGDLNLRDNEVLKVGIPQGMLDVWECVGSPSSKRFTWDIKENDNLNWPYPNKPSARYDRLYLMSGQCGSLRIPECEDLDFKELENGLGRDARFELVGKARLSKCGNRFPSDHWGIWAEFIADFPTKVAVTR